MPVTLTSLSDLAALEFDDIIDVRSPAEYAEDHLPGAISLPALSNEERARVGTIYTRESPFRARRIGAALVARNVATHLETVLADRPKSWKPLVYCWRGGQRSGSVALMFRQIGWQAETVDGGWRSYRRLVQSALYEAPWPAPLVILDGNTGTAKTDMLALLSDAGVQVIDLEGLANHRGSLFGGMAGGQPAQKGFETRLAMAALDLDPSRPVVVEAESSKIGNVRIPPALWNAMKGAPRVELRAPLAARAEYLARRYRDVTDDPARLLSTIDALRRQHPRDRIEDWQDMARAQAYEALASGLMEHHYDPRYGNQRARFQDRPSLTVDLDRLDPAALAQALPRVIAAIEAAQGA
ncbi:tRNA 2-selenouridine(34) synthase MnmH [Rhodovulum adriaticum]|uniref:tRNA 2-selenouridine synthase n=1 Tax=Rhodovulum adriaticum TaxID=35804 RepID=A0A4R2NKE6_RHOAD|nr:tRNA 2-selenouridine(34) synthase MnmH [Rhodovulum adriaticum]MBK1635558.1 tRNA 2-selenouridine(34) synthase MnmH [Rhodovulum adriaticum]TCP21808.1 tRNA 2-selenouridine synthase [Rhodovulum adriaticum]